MSNTTATVLKTNSAFTENEAMPKDTIKNPTNKPILKSTHFTHNDHTLSLSHHKQSSNGKHLKNNYVLDEDDDDDDDDDSMMHLNQYSISTNKPTKPTKVTLVKNHLGTNRTTSDSSSSKANTFKSIKPSTQNSTIKLDATKTTSDFKSLRSNDIKYKSDVCVPKSAPKAHRSDKEPTTKSHHRSPNKATALGRRKSAHSVSNALSSAQDTFTSMKRQHDEEVQHAKKRTKPSTANHKQIATTNVTASDTPQTLKAPSVVVSIPQHRRRNSMSDDHYNYFSLSKLKTANKKLKSSATKPSVSVEKSVMQKYVNEPKKVEKRNVPKLKIELTRLPQVPKSHEEEVQSPPFEMISFPSNITEYAKHIGLKPVEATCLLDTPPVSTDDTESTSQESKADDFTDKSLHKKRKKSNKHSKEPGGKRRKLHAEISSQQKESLKFKLKLTAANKPSKSERKVSFSGSSDDGTGSSRPVEVVFPKVSKPIEEIATPVASKPSSSIVNYSEFMGPPKVKDRIPILAIASCLASTPKRPLPPRRKSVAFARPQPPPVSRPCTPDYKSSSEVSYLNTSVSLISSDFNRPQEITSNNNNSLTPKRSMSYVGEQRAFNPLATKPKPSVIPNHKPNVPNLIRASPAKQTIQTNQFNAIPEMQIHKIVPNTHVEKPVSKFSRPDVEIFQIPPHSKESTTFAAYTTKTYPSSLVTTIPSSQLLPKVKLTHISPKKANGFSRDGALDLSGSKPKCGQDLSTKERHPTTRSPIAFIDITSPTKVVVEPHSRASNTAPTKSDAIAKSHPISTNNKHSTEISLQPNNKASASSPGGGLNLLYSALTHSITPNPITWLTPNNHSNDCSSDVLKQKVNELLLNEQRLQNLKLLSESALHREKILMMNSPMFTTINKPRPMMPKSHESNAAASRSSAVRQQNASIRNIPNPSALAFRNLGHTPLSLPPPLTTKLQSSHKTTINDSEGRSAATTSSSSTPPMLHAITVASPKSNPLPRSSPTNNNNTLPTNNNTIVKSNKSEAGVLVAKHHQQQPPLPSSPVDTNSTLLIVAEPNLHIETPTTTTTVVASSKAIVSSSTATTSTTSSAAGNSGGISSTTSDVTVG